jgi:ribonuclease P protein component
MTAPRATFRPHEHVRRPEDFRRAFGRRRPASDAALVVHVAENGLPYARLGISIGRKKVRKAAARNRLKRLVREAFRQSKAELPTGLDLIVVPRSPDLTYPQVRASLVALAHAAAARLATQPSKPTRP